jgi:hypothetical protein
MKNWVEYFQKKSRQDFYVLYELSLNEIHDHHNVSVLDEWFIYEKNENKDFLINDSIITVKRCDEETTHCLYGRVYNPLKLIIQCPTGLKFNKDDKGNLLYNMIVTLCSIDDSSFSIWFEQIPLKKLYYIRGGIKKWVDEKFFINGDELLKYCELLGANPEQKYYD